MHEKAIMSQSILFMESQTRIPKSKEILKIQPKANKVNRGHECHRWIQIKPNTLLGLVRATKSPTKMWSIQLLLWSQHTWIVKN